MPNLIQLKRSTTGGNVPSSGSPGELAVNLIDRKIYSNNGSSIVPINGAFGSTTQVQFNDGGYANGSAGLTFSKSSNNLTIANGLIVSLISMGNSTVNVVANSITYIVQDASASHTINSTAAAVGANVLLNTTNLRIGNSTVNAIINSTALTVNAIGIQNTSPAVGLQVWGNYGIKPTTISTSNNININCAVGNYFFATCNGSVANIYFTSAPASMAYSFVLRLANGGTNTISWANTPKWPSATAPSCSTNTDILVFFTEDGGTTWRGNRVQTDTR